MPPRDVETDVGRLDVAALERFRAELAGRDPLVEAAGFDALHDPRELTVVLADGIGDAESARFDVRWYTTGYYSVHHTDDAGVDCRWDYHPKPDAPAKHFHEPPDADAGTPVASCITVEEPPVVARAVHLLWRRAYDTGALAVLNEAENPP